MIRIKALMIGLAAAGLQCTVYAANQDTSPRSPASLIAEAIGYEHGEGVTRNASRAADLYCAAIRRGSPEAAYRLGWMYANGRGIDRDDGHAVALFQQASAQGHEYAKRMLRLVHSDVARLPPCLAAPGQAADEQAEAPASAPPGPAAAVDERAEVLAALTRWASAWSRRDVGAYLAAYAEDFAPASGQSRQQWEQQRQMRIAGKSWIAVNLDEPKISIDGNVARAEFRQRYRSDRYKESSSKTITLVKVDQAWLIRAERGSN